MGRLSPELESKSDEGSMNYCTTMISVNRPDIVKIVLESYRQYAPEIFQSTLYLNVDKSVVDYATQQDVADLCEKYFADIEYNLTDKPSFPLAFKWVMGKASSNGHPYTCFILDDWKLCNRLDVDDGIGFMEKYPDLLFVSISKIKKGGGRSKIGRMPKGDAYFYRHIEGNLYTSRKLATFGVNPTFIPKRLAGVLASEIDGTLTATLDSRKIIGRRFKKVDYGLYTIPDEEAFFIDIGQKWRRQHGICKSGIPGGKFMFHGKKGKGVKWSS